MSLIMVVVFAFLLAISYPVAHALVVGTTLGILSSDRIPMFAVIQQLMAPSQSFPLIAIPFFVMSGELMMTGKLGKHLIDFATDLVGRFRGDGEVLGAAHAMEQAFKTNPVLARPLPNIAKLHKPVPAERLHAALLSQWRRAQGQAAGRASAAG